VLSPCCTSCIWLVWVAPSLRLVRRELPLGSGLIRAAAVLHRDVSEFATSPRSTGFHQSGKLIRQGGTVGAPPGPCRKLARMLGLMSVQRGRKIGRSSKGDRVVTWVRLPRAVRDKADQIAAQRGCPVSDVVAALVELGLDHVDLGGLRGQETLPAREAS
jgi:hypothetical protein